MLPSTAAHISELANSPGTSLAYITNVVAFDLAQAATIINVANAALYNVRRVAADTRQTINLMELACGNDDFVIVLARSSYGARANSVEDDNDDPVCLLRYDERIRMRTVPNPNQRC